MISHSIITTRFRKKYEPPVVQQIETNYSTWDPNNVCTLGTHPTAEEYEKYLDSRSIKRGDYITFKYLPLCDHIARLHVVIDVIRPFSAIRVWENGHPKCFRLMQLFPESHPWIRNDVITAYRKLTDAEHNNLVVPNLDNIRNLIQKYQFADPE